MANLVARKEPVHEAAERARTRVGTVDAHQDVAAAHRDITTLYRELAPGLERLVARNITAPRALIEDACQIAWAALLVKREEVAPGRELGWLMTTASREALRQLRTARRELPIDDDQADELANVRQLTVPGPGQAVILRDRLAEIRALPLRQQRMVWLHGLGYDYHEISAQTGDSRRTVERQLLRAKHKLAAVED